LDSPLRGFEGPLELSCGLLAHESQARIYSEIGGEYPMVAFQVGKPLDLLMRNHRLSVAINGLSVKTSLIQQNELICQIWLVSRSNAAKAMPGPSPKTRSPLHVARNSR
jgi:hypothetical protein